MKEATFWFTQQGVGFVAICLLTIFFLAIILIWLVRIYRHESNRKRLD